MTPNQAAVHGALAQGVFLFALCWLLAEVEIQIEGGGGWAENAPTWRYSRPWLLKLTNGKPVTGYHLYLFSFLILIFHLPLLFAGFSRATEAQILASYFLLAFNWDFQWFAWNPAWGTKRFLREPIWWFKTKILGVPLDYYMGAVCAFLSTWLLAPALLPHVARLFAVIEALAVFSAGLAALVVRRVPRP
ncbi:MAG: hypothetical protein KGL04_09855 [Elusimicrobia bacterium]|nr:hypothetical protein [Elusimicrobiota bacterium]MDE2314462.1 hypothetical protein [Elusimicrobiota bacterium]